MKYYAGITSLNKKVKNLYTQTPVTKFWNPLYWLQVILSWPMSIESMNKFFSKEKIYCMFDNMKDSRRLVINARCVPDAGFLWQRNPKFTKFRLGRVFGKVSGTFMNEIFVHYDGEEVVFNMVDGTFVITKPREKISYMISDNIQEVSQKEKEDMPGISNDHFKILLEDMGSLILTMIDRGIGLNLTKQTFYAITEENSRGALVSKKRVVEIKELDIILDI